LTLAEKAYHMALKNGNHLTALCAAELIGRIAQHNSMDQLWHRMQYYIDGVINNSDRRKICHEVAETIKAQSNMTLGIFKDIPSWIKNGDFGAIPQKNSPLGFVLTKDTISPPLLCHAGITHMEYLFYHKKYADAINMAHLLKDVWNASPQPFGGAYIVMPGTLESLHCNGGGAALRDLIAHGAGNKQILLAMYQQNRHIRT